MADHQLTLGGAIDATVLAPEPTDAERQEHERLRLADEREAQRRRDEHALEIERAGWRHRAREAARRRSMTPAERERERIEALREAKYHAVCSSLPDVGQRDDARAIWDRVHGDIERYIAALPDDGDFDSWNAMLVAMDSDFIALSDGD